MRNEEIRVLKEKKKHYEESISRYRLSPLTLVTLIVITVIVTYGYGLSSIGSLDETNFVAAIVTYVPTALTVVGAITFIIAYVSFLLTTMLRQKLRDVNYRLASLDAEELQESIEEDFFNKLVKINFKYIDQYYLQTQEQADKSFRLTLFACVTGLAIIVAGIVMMFFDKTEPAYVTTAAGVLSEFVAAVFFYLYNKTVQKMSQYHHKLVITQNISLALKISEELPEPEKGKAQNKLIDKLTDNVNTLLAKTE